MTEAGQQLELFPPAPQVLQEDTGDAGLPPIPAVCPVLRVAVCHRERCRYYAFGACKHPQAKFK